MTRRPPGTSSQRPLTTLLAAGVALVVLAVIVAAGANPVLLLGSALAAIVAGAAGMVLLFRSSRALGQIGGFAAMVVGGVLIVAMTAATVLALGVALVAASLGDHPGGNPAPYPPEAACDPITDAQNAVAIDGSTLTEVEAVLAHSLALRDRYETTDGAEVEVYDWQQFRAVDGCDQYVSYEFRNGALDFRRFAPAS